MHQSSPFLCAAHANRTRWAIRGRSSVVAAHVDVDVPTVRPHAGCQRPFGVDAGGCTQAVATMRRCPRPGSFQRLSGEKAGIDSVYELIRTRRLGENSLFNQKNQLRRFAS